MSARYHQIPLEKRIKPILDRIHIVRDLINRAEYEENFDPYIEKSAGGRMRELPAIHSDLNPQCLQKNAKPIVLMIGGPSSASKDLAKMIERKYDLSFISIGDLIRQEIRAKTPMGQSVAEIVRRRQLVRPEIVVWLLKKEMLNRFRCAKGYIIEGFPRNLEQMSLFEEEVTRAHLVLFLEVDKAAVEKIWLSAEKNEKRDMFLSRLCDYHMYTDPLRNAFGKRAKVIHGTGRTAWGLTDSFLAKMMLEWCFLKEDVSGKEDLYCGDEFKATYDVLPRPYVRGERNEELGAQMFEILGGIIPYYVQWDCTRKLWDFPK